MSSFKNISEYNNYLANNLTKYSIEEYFKQIHNLFNKNVDISFMEYFLTLITNKNEFCVEHDKLVKYGIVTERKDNANIKRCIQNKNFDFKEDIDYVILSLNVEGQDKNKKSQNGHGGHNAKLYKMKPRAFKMCLMRSKNTNAYAKYYLELEECFYYYNKYQIQYKEVLMSGKDDKTDELNKKIDDLLKHAKNAESKLDEANENINEMKDDINDLNDKVEEVRDEFRENLEHISPPINEKDKIDMFMILQDKTNLNTLTIIRGQKKHLTKKDKDGKNVLIDGTYNPNSINLFNHIKSKIKKLNRVKKDTIKQNYKKDLIDISEKNKLLKEFETNPAIHVHYTTIIINPKFILLDEFLDLVNGCDNLRRETYVP